MPDHVLPATFSDLEPFAEWSLATEPERNRKRMSSTMNEIVTFYNVMLSHADAVFDYLNQFPLETLPADAQRLLYLTLALAEVAPAVELYKQPGVIDGYDPRRFIPMHGL